MDARISSFVIGSPVVTQSYTQTASKIILNALQNSCDFQRLNFGIVYDIMRGMDISYATPGVYIEPEIKEHLHSYRLTLSHGAVIAFCDGCDSTLTAAEIEEVLNAG
jgi:hypothetical protein